MTEKHPDGYQMRPLSEEYMEATLQTINLAYQDAVGVSMMKLSDLREDMETPGFDMSRDTRILVASNGEVAGYFEVWDLSEPHVRITTWGQIHPQHRANGAGAALLEWAKGRGAQALKLAPPEAKVAMQGYALHADPAMGASYQASGFALARHSLRMVIELDAPPAEPEWPQGIWLRTYDPQEGLPEVLRAVRESFRDHYGYVESPFEQELERWEHRKLKSPDFDPSLWFIAMDESEIAGISLCDPQVYDDPEMGWVGTLGVRRPWRRRGLGMALLLHPFGEFYRRGVRMVGLGVDASNLTGALRLYQRAGMRSDASRQYDMYEHVLREGMELFTVAVEA